MILIVTFTIGNIYLNNNYYQNPKIYPMNLRTKSLFDCVFKFITQLQLVSISLIKFQPTSFQYFPFFEFYRRQNWAVVLAR